MGEAAISAWQREVLDRWPEDWAAASDVLGRRCGNTASVLADKGFLERRSDPTVWGRSQYRKVSA